LGLDQSLPSVLHVVLSLNPGGTERLVVDMCTQLASNARVGVCCLDELGTWGTQLQKQGIPVVALHRRQGFRPALGRQVAKVAEALRCSVLHCHQYSPYVYGRVAALWNPRLRIVYTEHGRLSDAKPSAKRRFVNPVLGRLPGVIVAVSHDLAFHMVSAGFPGSRIRVIHNGIVAGPPPSVEDRIRVRKELGLGADIMVVGTIARLDPVKDLGTLVRGFSLLPRMQAGSKLVVIGDGPERAALEEVVRQQSCGDAVLFVGERSDARGLLPAFDIYANTSTTEGISITILEAMSATLPVVATRAGGTPEILTDGETGMLVPPRSPELLAEALGRLIDDPATRAAMGSAGRQRVEEAFGFDRMVADYLRAYGPRFAAKES